VKVSSPSWIKIDNGEYAKGKRIQVTSESQYGAVATIREELEFLLSVQRPGDKVTLECRDISTARGELVACQISLTRNPYDA